MTQKFDITTARPVKGVHRIEANAGTGKTYTLEHLFVRLLFEEGLEPQEILMLTFSRRAVADLQRRISDRCLKEADTRSGTRSLRRPFEIYTFHGFFYRLLQLFPFASHINTGGEMITRPSLVTRPLAGMIMRDFCYESPDMTSFVMENYGSRVTNDYGAAGFLSKLYSMKHAHGAEAASEKEPDTALKQLIQGVSAHADAVRTVYKTLAEEAAVLTAFLADKNNINGKFFKAPSLAKVERTLSRMAAESSIFALYDTMNEQFPPEWVDKNIKVPFPFRFFNELQVLHPEHTRLKKQFMGVLSSYVSRHMADCAGDHITYDIIQKEGIALAVQEPARSYLKETYRAVLIDEFQDTDSQQQRFLKELFYDGQHYTYLVGDAKQSIYSFRGANVQSAAGREDQIIRYSLSDNYRSGRILVDAVNRIFAPDRNPFIFDGLISNTPSSVPDIHAEKPAGRFIFNIIRTGGKDNPSPKQAEADEEDTDDMPAENMTALLTQRMGELLTGSAEIPAYIPKDIAVLVHTNRHAAKICAALRACGIPAMVDRSQALLSSAEAAAVLSMLKLLSPSGSADFYSHLAGNVLLPYTISDIIRLRNSLSEAESIKQKLFRASAVLDKKGIIAAFRFLDEAFAISSRLACLEDGRQRLRNYTDALCFLNSLAARTRHTPQRLIDAFEAEISTPSEDLKTRQEKDGNTVKVLTVHAAKGLEFPCVFLLLQDSKKPSDSLNVFHNPENNYEPEFVNGGNGKEQYEIEIEAEKIRLLYVGMTRASQHCEVIFSETLKQYREQLDPVIQTAGEPDNPVQVIYADPGKISADFIYRPAVPELIKPVVPDIFIAKPLIRRSFSALLAKSYLTEYTSADTVSHIKEAESGTENADIQKTDTDKNPEQENITPKPALAGTQLGSLVHEIFEVCSLSKPYDAQLPVISPIMDAYGAQPADREYVRATVNQVSACPLTGADNTTFTLSEVPDALRIREMLFMMRFHNLDLHACRARLTALNNDYARHIAEIMNSKGFDVFDYLEGYIDAVIEYNGKLYILDWKTNNLGTAAENYSPQALRHTMHEAGYLLQQLIYTLGLRCYVASRMPGVPFDKVFGGVYYIFTRGLLTGEVSSASGKQVNGIFYSTAAELLPLTDILYAYTASENPAA